MFKRRKDSESPSQPQPQAKPEYTIDMVYEMLDTVGLSRLRVINPRVMVLLTLIAQNGESHLKLMSGDEPTEITIMDFMEQLKSLQRVIEHYITIQDNPGGYGNSDELLYSGLEAVEGLASQVLNKSASSERQSLTDFHVDTKILQSLSARNT